jgi:hypothetical protein
LIGGRASDATAVGLSDQNSQRPQRFSYCRRIRGGPDGEILSEAHPRGMTATYTVEKGKPQRFDLFDQAKN